MIWARTLARCKFASQYLKSVSCGSPEILFILLIEGVVLWEGTLDGVCGYLLQQKGKTSFYVPESETLYDTLQIRLLLRKDMFSHIQTTHQPDLSTVSLQLNFLSRWLAPDCATKMWSECLSTISPQPTVSTKWGSSSSYASSLPQVPNSVTR